LRGASHRFIDTRKRCRRLTQRRSGRVRGRGMIRALRFQKTPRRPSRRARKAAPDPRQSQIKRACRAIVNAVYCLLIIFGLNSLTSAFGRSSGGRRFSGHEAGRRVFVTA
jgi:hypothetical protein